MQRIPAPTPIRGLTARNATMFGEPGHLYVYRHMGLHSCMNIVADAAGTGTGCLIRAGEVVGGVETALARRQAAGVCRTERDLARGPGRATVASGITFADDGLDLCRRRALGMHLTGRLDPQDRPDGEQPGEEPLLPHPAAGRRPADRPARGGLAPRAVPLALPDRRRPDRLRARSDEPLIGPAHGVPGRWCSGTAAEQGRFSEDGSRPTRARRPRADAARAPPPRRPTPGCR